MDNNTSTKFSIETCHSNNSDSVHFGTNMGDVTLESAMCICIEGPDHLFNDTLVQMIDHYRAVKHLNPNE